MAQTSLLQVMQGSQKAACHVFTCSGHSALLNTQGQWESLASTSSQHCADCIIQCTYQCHTFPGPSQKWPNYGHPKPNCEKSSCPPQHSSKTRGSGTGQLHLPNRGCCFLVSYQAHIPIPLNWSTYNLQLLSCKLASKLIPMLSLGTTRLQRLCWQHCGV